jgi:hypothetical protein
LRAAGGPARHALVDVGLLAAGLGEQLALDYGVLFGCGDV